MNKELNNCKELGDCVVLYADNYLNDIEGEKLEIACDTFLNKGKIKVVIDFGNTELVNSIGVSILIGIMEKVREKKGVLLFSSLKKANHYVLDVLGLTKHVPVLQSEDEALKKLLIADVQEILIPVK